MKNLSILLFFLTLLQIQVLASPKEWGESFLERYRQGDEDILARLTRHRAEIDGNLYSELFKVLSDDVKYEDYRINFDVITGSPSNVTSLRILKAEESSILVETGYEGARGPATTRVKLLLKNDPSGGYKVADVVYTDWSTPTNLSALLQQIQNPDYSTEPLDLTPDFVTGRRLLKDQSFLFSEGGLYPLRFVSSVSDGNKPHLELYAHEGNGGLEPVKLTDTVPSSWKFQDIQALAFGDFNQDGFGPDVLCVATYVTGAGPTGAQPFPVTRVFYRTRYKGIKQSKGDPYSTDPKKNKLFDEKEITTISAALRLLKP